MDTIGSTTYVRITPGFCAKNPVQIYVHCALLGQGVATKVNGERQARLTKERAQVKANQTCKSKASIYSTTRFEPRLPFQVLANQQKVRSVDATLARSAGPYRTDHRGPTIRSSRFLRTPKRSDQDPFCHKAGSCW